MLKLQQGAMRLWHKQEKKGVAGGDETAELRLDKFRGNDFVCVYVWGKTGRNVM